MRRDRDDRRESPPAAARRLAVLGVVSLLTSGCTVRVQAPHIVVGTPAPVIVQTAPPPPPSRALQRAPAQRPGYVLVQGHYQWNGRRWVWSAHRYIPVQAGHQFVQPHYDQRRGVWVRGHWIRTGRGQRRGPPPPPRR